MNGSSLASLSVLISWSAAPLRPSSSVLRYMPPVCLCNLPRWYECTSRNLFFLSAVSPLWLFPSIFARHWLIAEDFSLSLNLLNFKFLSWDFPALQFRSMPDPYSNPLVCTDRQWFQFRLRQHSTRLTSMGLYLGDECCRFCWGQLTIPSCKKSRYASLLGFDRPLI